VVDRPQHHIHRLAGSGATFGYPAVSGIARSTEDALRRLPGQSTTMAPEIRTDVDALIARLRAVPLQTPRETPAVVAQAEPVPDTDT